MSDRSYSRSSIIVARDVDRPRCGFTLLELVVSIGIIALLVCILLPSLESVRCFAKLTKCKSRLRQWGNAFAMYASSNNGFYPHIDGPDRGSSEADNFGWVDVLPPLIGEKPWREHPQYHRPGTDTIFQCPTAELSSVGYGYYPRQTGYFSYAMNSCLELDANCYSPLHGGSPDMPPFLNINRIVYPARTILLFDQLLDPYRGYGGNGRNRSAGEHCGSYPKDFAVRHAQGNSDKGGFIMHCDYSVWWVETVWKEHWPPRMKCPPRDDPDWFPYPPANDGGG